jgi:hypothetical protein
MASVLNQQHETPRILVALRTDRGRVQDLEGDTSSGEAIPSSVRACWRTASALDCGLSLAAFLAMVNSFPPTVETWQAMPALFQ